MKPLKIPESVLVVIHSADLRVLLIERADQPGFWQSVTGSIDTPEEPLETTAIREVFEETGIVVGSPLVPACALSDWALANVYEIYPVWRHRYGPGVTHNTEHVFGLEVPVETPIMLAPREHLRFQWLPWQDAADACFSPSNAEAILQLPRRVPGAARPDRGLLVEPAVCRVRSPSYRLPMNPLPSSELSTLNSTASNAGPDSRLRVATYNIHKGVRGLGPARRLEIHNLCQGVKVLDADMVFLQEVRSLNRQEARKFPGWPALPQADFLAPEGYDVAYHTNAFTKHGEHGNALLSRWSIGQVGHHDVSEHRFEQRGLLHGCVAWQGTDIHAIVAHFGLGHAGRVRQAERLGEYIEANVPHDAPLVVAGDFNDWGEKLDTFLHPAKLTRAVQPSGQRALTFPSRVPVFAMDRIYTRRFKCVSTFVPRGTSWARMSDHLPLVAEFELV